MRDRTRVGQFNYRQENLSGCGPEIELNLPSNPHRNFVSLANELDKTMFITASNYDSAKSIVVEMTKAGALLNLRYPVA